MTPRQKDCLDFIEAFWARHGYSPTYTEIQAGLTLASRSRVFEMVHALAERGHIVHFPKRQRGIVPVVAFDQPTPALINVVAAAMRLLMDIIDEAPEAGTAVVRAEALGDLDIAVAEAGVGLSNGRAGGTAA